MLTARQAGQTAAVAGVRDLLVVVGYASRHGSSRKLGAATCLHPRDGHARQHGEQQPYLPPGHTAVPSRSPIDARGPKLTRGL